MSDHRLPLCRRFAGALGPSLGLVPGTEPARRFEAALREGDVEAARRAAVEEAPGFELRRFVVEPLVAKLETLPRHFAAGREAARKLSRMLIKDLVDTMYGGRVETGGHQGADGRWYVYRGLSPDLVEVSGNVIENVDKARFVDWLEPIESLLNQHLNGMMDRAEFLEQLQSDVHLDAAAYPHRLHQEAAAPGVPDRRAAARAVRAAPWDPEKDPDLRVCFSGDMGSIVVGSGQSHLVDQAYHDALRVVRQMTQRDLLTVARRVPGEMLQPDYPNLIRNVLARVTPILGLPPERRQEIREDMAEGGRDNLLLMLALSRARHAGWLGDDIVEEIYALRQRSGAEEPLDPAVALERHRILVAQLTDEPYNRAMLQDLDVSAARILLNDAVMLLEHERSQPTFVAPADRVRRGLALLKLLSLQGALDGFLLYPYAGPHLFAAQFSRMAALYEKGLAAPAVSDRQRFLDTLAAEDAVYRKAGVNSARIAAQLVTQRVNGLVAHAGSVAQRAMQSALKAIPDQPVTLLLQVREWVAQDRSSPVWAHDLGQAFARIAAPWAAALRDGDYVVLFEADAAFKNMLVAQGDFEEVDLALSSSDLERPSSVPRSAVGPFDLPRYAAVLRKQVPEAPKGQA